MGNDGDGEGEGEEEEWKNKGRNMEMEYGDCKIIKNLHKMATGGE